MRGVNEGVEADFCKNARAMRGDFTEELADDALRKTVRLDVARKCELAKAGRKIPVAANDAL